MSFKNLMIIKSLVSLGFGVLMLAIPDTLLSIFGAALGDGGMFTAREYGAGIIREDLSMLDCKKCKIFSNY